MTPATASTLLGYLNYVVIGLMTIGGLMMAGNILGVS